jgi:tetratricopeptide (TPR) repeat protein
MTLFGKWFGFHLDEVYEAALNAYDLGDYEEAIEAFEWCLDHATEGELARVARIHLSQGHAKLGIRALHSGSAGLAVSHFRSALELFPDYPDLRLQLARALGAQGRREEQAREVERALKINPNFIEAVLYRGILMYEEGRREEAWREVGRAIEADPALRNRRFEEACAAREEGDHHRAVLSLQALQSVHSADPLLFAEMGASFAREGFLSDAADEYARAVELAPDSGEVRCRYGSVLLGIGRIAEALEQLEAALQLNPDDGEARRLVEAARSRDPGRA